MALKTKELGMVPFLLHQTIHPYYHIFNHTFQLSRVDTQALREASHKLRYQVFCIENQLKNPEDYPNGLEIDTFDDYADSFVLMHRHTRMVIGTIRVIFPDENKLDTLSPIYSVAPEAAKYCQKIGEVIPEISRFCISKESEEESQTQACMKG